MSLLTVIILTVVIAILIGIVMGRLMMWLVEAYQRDSDNITEIRVVFTLMIVSLGVALAFSVDSAVRIQSRISYFL